jgi:hypothetical protein
VIVDLHFWRHSFDAQTPCLPIPPLNAATDVISELLKKFLALIQRFALIYVIPDQKSTSQGLAALSHGTRTVFMVSIIMDQAIMKDRKFSLVWIHDRKRFSRISVGHDRQRNVDNFCDTMNY